MTVSTTINTPEKVGLCGERLNKIPDYFQGYLDRKKVSGMSFLIARRGEIAYQHCMGVKDFDTGSKRSP